MDSPGRYKPLNARRKCQPPLRAVGDDVTACLPGTAWSALMPSTLPLRRGRNAPCQRVNALAKADHSHVDIATGRASAVSCQLNIFAVRSLFDLHRSHSFAGYLP
ncbi:hypothetical protein XAP412_1250015 [Xanthomonas phaseoli pv. phaseoli]|uniref:Uncharacterized protein n=1 Tax=Xanthomonas campestris pv. phaseoli TaxID=317013 RepID=A0AB38DVS3_XANCH|nr:hypothetical protein XAP6984_1280014 [Xanthomonas phaseoli pv. phaseoli]SON77730.1 hypothetical protein XAP412_1250015 [Xanthomonas phaseoli pv. phaseoli]SON82211.1 hypothetical protein XAP7430_1260015 [Xanthomonas phaseoli pv. phaseoli]